MFEKKKSLVPYVRRQLGVKGSTHHDGRGIFEMEVDVSFAKLVARVKAKLPQWESAGLVEGSRFNEDGVEVRFSRKVFSEYYRTFLFTRETVNRSRLAAVVFTFDR